ncbi:MAG: deoxyribodipyrimidine photo-lyase, partial [Robiginitalea sp.]|nr:deoxyribodipyrimidine photo-lyase [Robiginitalea sp.]
MKPSCTVFWFKRDLRLEDNEALATAVREGENLLLLYLLEPSLYQDPHYSERHWDFIRQSLWELQQSLAARGSRILCVREEALTFFRQLQQEYTLKAVYSHCETGIGRTYQRDLALAHSLRTAGIPWKEYQANGVVRGLRDRTGWASAWQGYMSKPLAQVSWNKASLLPEQAVRRLETRWRPMRLKAISEGVFQVGGRKAALACMDSFFSERIRNYSIHISKPEASRSSCSRLSPYLAWGNLSIREVYQRLQVFKKEGRWRRQANAFGSRLRWHCHFIQKFEMEPRMEYEAINRAFIPMKQPLRPEYIRAWETGKTGYPLVDAAMRCLRET